ncbi:MAG: HAMP domain-containing histidine kinase [Deltaproteobacteria bacterium]|nr:HAMP domain-containing histidine kinase [Deltaproteobacteria bacterium]
MTKSLSATFAVLILMSLGLVAWLGARVALDEQEILRHRFRGLLEVTLSDVRSSIDTLLARRQKQMAELLRNLPERTNEFRHRAKSSPYVHSLFALDRECQRIHPPQRPPWTKTERAFLLRADPLWVTMGQLCRQPPTIHGGKGWQKWTWKDMRLAYWQRKPDGSLSGVEVNTMRLWSDIIGSLPSKGLNDGLISLDSPMGETWYRWGQYRPKTNEAPDASLTLNPPLDAWRLTYHASDAALAGSNSGSILFGLTSTLVMACLLLVGLAIFFYRSNLRRLREAAQRVSFVNRVSHELRTPLTNIRLYAEMLGENLSGEKKAKQRLDIILDETARLGRLINNILAFSRQERGKETLYAKPRKPDEVIAATIAQFEPAMARKKLQLCFEANAHDIVMLDADALEQILGNLLSNAEKYASDGAQVLVSTSMENRQLVVRVADQGPGIPTRQQDRIFEAFHRASEKLTDQATGTGLGLAIARDLARLHGGDLKLLPSPKGACFEFRIRTPKPEKPKENRAENRGQSNENDGENT